MLVPLLVTRVALATNTVAAFTFGSPEHQAGQAPEPSLGAWRTRNLFSRQYTSTYANCAG